MPREHAAGDVQAGGAAFCLLASHAFWSAMRRFVQHWSNQVIFR
jgi:hypothetical protein